MEISKSELQIMNAIWQLAPCDAASVIEHLNKNNLATSQSWHEKTVKTLLGRLVKKGALEFKKQGRTYIYSPQIEQSEFQQTESLSFVQRLFRGRLSPLVASFAKSDKLTKQDVDELKQIIKDWESNKEK